MWEKIKKRFLDFLLRQSVKNILYVFLLLFTIGISGIISFFMIEVYLRDMNRSVRHNSQKLADQLNVSTTQYVHRMIQMSDTLYYDVLRNNVEYTDQIP